ncbi:TerD family protein [Brevibacillus sp. NPDC058079]|uniref:TerD family protein n=1 Tax=Brevibacillus sp. NPDC058079 TaxID=3346330 RepID=UPI0036E8BB4F
MGIEVGGSNQGQGRTLSLGGAIPTPAPTPNVQPSAAQAAAPKLELFKSDKLFLVKEQGRVEEVRFGGGWDPAEMGLPWDLDLCAIILDASGSARMGKFVCFDKRYHVSEEDALRYSGDNQDGKGDDIDEYVDMTFGLLKPDDVKIKLYVHIHNAANKGQHFGLVKNAFCRIEESNTKAILAQFNLTDNYSGFTAIELGDFDRSGDVWSFTAIGRGMNEECETTIGRYL